MILYNTGALERRGIDEYTKTDGNHHRYFEQNVV